MMHAEIGRSSGQKQTACDDTLPGSPRD